MMAPADGAELEAMLEFALSLNKPCVIRYPKAACLQIDPKLKPVELGSPVVLRQGQDYCLIAAGSMVAPALEACDQLLAENISGVCINARFIKPLDAGVLKKCMLSLNPAAPIITVEDGVAEGGFGSAVSEALCCNVERIGFPSQFIVHGKRQILFEKYGLDPAGIALRIKKALKKNGKGHDR